MLAKILELHTLAYEANDPSALQQLIDLVENDPSARAAYLQVAWLEAHLPFASSLLRHGVDGGTADAWLDASTGLSAENQTADVEFKHQSASRDNLASSLNSVEVGTAAATASQLPALSKFYRIPLVTMAAVVLVAALILRLWFGGDDVALVTTDDHWAAIATIVPDQPADSPQPAGTQNIAAANLKPPVKSTSIAASSAIGSLAHPVGTAKVTGGQLIDEAPIPDEISFNFHVRPILSENCFYCHGPDATHRFADLRLDTQEGSLQAIEPGDPDSSELVNRILEQEDADYQMPPSDSGRSLTDRQIEILKKWIQQGAQYETHWAFTKPEKPSVPAVQNHTWPRNEIDRFVLAKLENRDIKPSPRAEPTKIIRRMYIDLIGFPPTQQQVDSFLTDYAKDANASIDRLADQLLASPHYGERMALPWLDAARYSDSNGFQEDGDRSQWPWRDWVVDAMNNDMPFDRFTIEQLAGDLLPNPDQSQLIATAFNRNHMLNGEGGALAAEQRNNYVFDRVDTTATTWLGMTMACAQCHDHKYDPITQEDYYKFFAFFNNVKETGRVDIRINRIKIAQPYLELSNSQQKSELKQWNVKIAAQKKVIANMADEIDLAVQQWEARYHAGKLERNVPRSVYKFMAKDPKKRTTGEVARIRKYFLDNASVGKIKQAQQKLRDTEQQKRDLRVKIPSVMIMQERKNLRATHVLERGNYEAPKQQVSTGIPGFLAADKRDQARRPMSRLDLANWLVSDQNPLTSRVQVNRYWQLFFGTGLVKTSEDFGVQGELPSHPDLLEWLAVDFRDHRWSVKRMHRMIVTSETYLQSSKFRPELNEIDPENRLLARSPRFRMHSMAIRDSALQVSGLLNIKIGGEPVYPPQPAGLWKEFSLERFSYRSSRGADLYRRSLYTFWRRTVAPPNMFDTSNRQTCTVKLSRTNTPLHALTLLNDPTYVEAACCLAQEILQRPAPGGDSESTVVDQDESKFLAVAFKRCLGRSPNSKNKATLRQAWQDSLAHFRDHPVDARSYVAAGPGVDVPQSTPKLIQLASLASVIQVIMNTDEFITRE